MTTPEIDTGFGDDAVKELSYNFDKWLPEGERTGRHVIPEPSTDQISDFWTAYFKTLDGIRRERGEEAPKNPDGTDAEETPDERDDRIARNIALGQQAAMKANEERKVILAELCSNTPDRETLDKLPHRVIRAFEAYIVGAFSPEA